MTPFVKPGGQDQAPSFESCFFIGRLVEYFLSDGIQGVVGKILFSSFGVETSFSEMEQSLRSPDIGGDEFPMHQGGHEIGSPINRFENRPEGIIKSTGHWLMQVEGKIADLFLLFLQFDVLGP